MTRSSSNLDQILAANRKFADQFGARSQLGAAPARKFAVLTCMDARMDPAQFAGIAEGDAHIIRNAGGRASEDAIRSLVISHKLLGTLEWLVIQHTQCGMATISNAGIAQLLAESLDPAQFDGKNWSNSGQGTGSAAGFEIEWHCIDNLEKSVRDDVVKIASHPLVSKKVSIAGYIYDVADGLLKAVAGANRPGC